MKRNLLLLSLVALLAAGIFIFTHRAWQVYKFGVSVPRIAEASEHGSGSSVVGVAPAEFAPEAVDMDALLDRAVFERSRSRPEKTPEPEPEIVMEDAPKTRSPLNVSVLGIIKQEDTGFVVVRTSTTSRPVQVSVGEAVDGWTLIELSEFFVVFERDGEETRVNLALQ